MVGRVGAAAQEFLCFVFDALFMLGERPILTPYSRRILINI